MQKQQFKKIVIRSTLVLIIPLLGEVFVKGWNWGIEDFVFAWVFFTILGIAYTFVTGKVQGKAKIVAGVVVIAAFAFIWIKLATG